MPGPLLRRDPGGDDGVPQARPVEVYPQAVLPGPGADRLDLFDRVDPATTAVVRVLQADETRANAVLIDRPDLVFQLADVEDPVVPLDRPARDAAQDRRAARLVVVDVAAHLAKQLVAGLRMGPDAN